MVTHPDERSTSIVLNTVRIGNFYSLVSGKGTDEFKLDLQGDNPAMRGLMNVLDEQAYDNFHGTFTMNWNENTPQARTFVMDGDMWRRLLVGIKTHYDYIGS